MPYANNQGIRIHYQVQGDGPPLVLHHGITQSWEDWQEKSYTKALSRDYQLILLDARGHGASDKPHDPAAYALPLRVTDVTAVLDDLNIRQAHFFGYSMGGWIGFGMAKYAPERLHSLIIGGAHPYEESMQPFREPMSKGMEGLVSFAEAMFGQWLTPAGKTRLISNDLQALIALAQDRPSIEDVLPTMTMPCLLFSGDADFRYAEIQECAKHMPNVTFVSLPECDHFAAMAKSDLVLPHITKFLQAVSQS
ncbi:alpha/beta fold hydrolase [Fischerella sp. PCC 9605]|uniref:alpha/beta fold hydrolase n=1 Tax=Fischerella sp. PCC 9605 TaxID=1173024 RepID=UPI000478C490|nr:alpha/beta fold hydrolase [Fischerella sp. PCC 9605]